MQPNTGLLGLGDYSEESKLRGFQIRKAPIHTPSRIMLS